MKRCIIFVALWSFLASIGFVDAQTGNGGNQEIIDAATKLRPQIATLLGAGQKFNPNTDNFRNNAPALISLIDDIVATQNQFPTDPPMVAAGSAVTGLLAAQNSLSALLLELKALLLDYQDTTATVNNPCVADKMNSYLTDVAEAITALIRENLLAMSNLLVTSNPTSVVPYQNVALDLQLSLYLGDNATQVIQAVLANDLGLTTNDANKVENMLDTTRNLLRTYADKIFTAVIHAQTDAIDLINDFVKKATATTITP